MRKEIISLIAGIGLMYAQAGNAAVSGEMKPSAKQATTATTMENKHSTTVKHKHSPVAHQHHHHHKHQATHHAKHQHYKHHHKHAAAHSKTENLHQKQFSKTHKSQQKPVSYESDYGPKGAKSQHEVMKQSSLEMDENDILDNSIGRDRR